MATAPDQAAEDGREARTAAVLRVLASLAPDRRAPEVDVSGSGPTAMGWLGVFGSSTDDGDPTSVLIDGAPRPLDLPRLPSVEALARHDALTPGSDDLRLGWLWVAGRVTIADTPTRIVLPLLSRPARVRQSGRRLAVDVLGPWDLWPLVDDDLLARSLEQDAAFGGGALTPQDTSQQLVDRLTLLRTWVDKVVAASDLPPIGRLAAPVDPTVLRPGDGLDATVGFGLFASRPVDLTRPRETLRHWSRDPATADTALAQLYLGPERPGDHAVDAPTFGADAPAVSPLPLGVRQAEVVARARIAPVTVVSGPPGTGKSQTAAAVALDTVARGGSVLVATRSAEAADVLASLLARVPGPDPVLFGGSVLANRLAAHLADGTWAEVDREARGRADAARRELAELWGATADELADVAAVSAWERRSLTASVRRDLAPALFADADPPLDRAEGLLRRARSPSGPFAGWRSRRAAAALRRLAGAPDDADTEGLATALEVARLRARARRAQRRDPSVAARRWSVLAEADDAHRDAWASAQAAEIAERAGNEDRRAVAALATALRAGRAARRAHLARIDVTALTRALPLWVGTLGEVEALLPAVAGAFDLVVLDEASQIDQQAASAALLRARRGVVVGDPRQLRFVSFVADRAVATAVEVERATDLADRLDVRRVSAFDLAAGVAPVTFLDEHHRSVPHLIGFSARRFYDDRLLVATRHPYNEAEVAVEVRTLPDGVRTDGVNHAEVEAALDLVDEVLASDPTVSVGVVSPYRAQVDALEAAIADHVDLDVLQAGRVKIGTVHGFQGAECDVVVASFGIGGAGDRGRAFLEDPNLFNVLITRARHRLVALVSGEAPTSGLLAEYLRWAETPLAAHPGEAVDDPWTERLREVLADAGTPVRTGYPVGRWSLDLVVGEGAGAIAVTTRVHPDGVDAHVRRHLALRRAGWTQVEAFPTDRGGDAVAAALALRDRVTT